jgi:formamidopyrimidine-DNA glycosylase
MPELPEVETVRRGLEKLLPGRRIVSVDVRERRLRYLVDVDALERHVAGRRVTELTRRAKYLLIHLEGDAGGESSRLVIHLGMSGHLLVLRADEPLAPHTHVIFDLDDGRQLRFADHRRFGLVDAIAASDLATDKRFVHLGVEPLSQECDSAYLFERSRGVRKPVKNFLMDAQQVVGVGNIYACESLHVAGVHPTRAAGRISRERWAKITEAVKKVLSDAIRQGGTTLSDFQNAEGDAGYFQTSLQAYGREGEPCGRCGDVIRRKVMSGRSTFYCAGCQR